MSKTHLKGKRARRKYRKSNCEQCGVSGAFTQLDTHHINHDPTDNRKVNLQTLCKQCHTQHHRIVAKLVAYNEKRLNETGNRRN